MSGRGKGSTLTKDQYYDICFKIRKIFNSSHQAEYTQVLKINDPVLRNIALYFAEIYNELNTFCSSSCLSTGRNCIQQCKDHCEYLNKWLHEKEALYTSHGKCAQNRKLWSTYIEPLVNKLIQNTETEGSWCTIKSVIYNGYLPENWIPKSCNNTDPIEVSPSCNNVPGHASEGLSRSHSSSSQLSPASAALGYFSPFRYWLNNFTRRIKRTTYNNNEASEELYGSSSSSALPLENSNIHMAYHSKRS
ncbi:PIR Superfamily Protein [Plasmodium ovale curtisi]|uniref:PIR Superfamily Protein n=1 Tax=Plasmodium ovale curtisi TaxID=864141 RepID=A0A1A8VMS4_PLAOA|nr:PIR Superfamily Protein [Plasmodium ovale curtisi]